jgi:hypothetical protein
LTVTFQDGEPVDPKKLQDLLSTKGISLTIPPLNETLAAMLVEAKNGSQKI